MKIKRILYSVLILIAIFEGINVFAGTVISPQPIFRALDSNGDPLSGGLIYTYVTGTSTPLATYDNDGNANANPVVLDSNGEAEVWLDDQSIYRFVLTDSDGVTQWTIDSIQGSGLFIPVVTQLSDYADLAAAVTAIGATPTELWIDEDAVMDENITPIPTTLKFKFIEGNEITTTGYSLGFAGSPQDHIIALWGQQIFIGTGAVTFGDGGLVSTDWWDIDGTADEVQINYAFSSLPSDGGTVVSTKDSYTIAAAITPVSNSIWYSTGNSVITTTSDIHVISVVGSIVSDTIAVSITQGDESFTATTGASFTAGDWIYLDNGKTTNTNVEGDPGRKYELCRVKSVVSNTITVESPIINSYATTDTAQAHIMTAKENITIRDITIDYLCTSPTNRQAIDASYCVNLNVENVVIKANDYSRGIKYSQCFLSSIDNCKLYDTAGSFSIGLLYGSNKSTLTKNKIFNHAENGTGDAALLVYYGVQGSIISENAVLGSGVGGIYIHTKCTGNTISTNTVSGVKGGGSTGGIGSLYGSYGNTYIGNTVTGSNYGFILNKVRNETIIGAIIQHCNNLTDDQGIYIVDSFDIDIKGGDIGYCDEGVRITISATASERILIDGVKIHNCDGRGVQIDNINELTFVNNDVYSNGSDGVLITASVTNLTILNNSSVDNTGRGFYVEMVYGQFRGNYATGNGDDGIELYSSCYGYDLSHNISIANTGYGLGCNASTNDGMIYANRISGNTAGEIQTALTAAPNAGTWEVGQIAYHTAPAKDGNARINYGWVCTVAGTPGTWEALWASSATW